MRVLSAVLLAGCGHTESGPLPDVQRAGEIALETGSAAAFQKLYPGSTPEGSPDECAHRIGRGERCGDAPHIDVTLTHSPEGGGAPVELLVEIGPRGKVLYIEPSPSQITDATKCDADDDCVCAACTGCVNETNLPAKLATETPDCQENRCKTSGCRCAGGTCRTR
jgi:hypothetical protein